MDFAQSFNKKNPNIKTPYIVYDLDLVGKNYKELIHHFPDFSVFFAMKCNSNPKLVEHLKKLGSGFEIASLNEAKQLINQSVPGNKIICMHPIKSPDFLKYMHREKIHTVAVDSYEEVDKISKYSPESKIVVRVGVDNHGSGWDLSSKFGVETKEVPELLRYIKSKKLSPFGLTFHVGSQCTNLSNWSSALRDCDYVYKSALANGIQLSFLSIGGGFPIQNKENIIKLPDISKTVLKNIPEGFVNFAMEPGRFLVAESGVLVSQIFGVAQRKNINWIYIDVGTYNGLIEAIETPDRRFYPASLDSKSTNFKYYNVGGPSCVGIDTPFINIKLPEAKVGDLLFIRFAGAYTVVCGAPFNGFPVPEEYFL